jgi:arsenite-transporting ATPase
VTRIILYTGKGGVGKTSIAAATALAASQRGLRTVVLSTDAAHSLGDSFDRGLGPEPVQIAERLWAQECDVYFNMEKYWSTVQRWMESLLAWEGFDRTLVDEMVVLPGMDELASLLWILEHHRTGNYDLIVVDCAPTAETFRLLSFPDAGRWWLDKIFPVSRRISGIARPVLKRLTNMPLPDDTVFEATRELMVQIDAIRELLADPVITSIRLVTNPERMVIKETQRAYTLLGLYGYLTDLVVCNRVLPPEALAGAYFAERAAEQERYLSQLNELFAPVPLKYARQFSRELVGSQALEALAATLFQGDDPTQFYYDRPPFAIHSLIGADAPTAAALTAPVGAEYDLTLALPLAERGDLDLVTAGEELVIEVGRQRRNMLLPRTLQSRPVLGAKMHEGTLHVWFGARTS